MFESIIVIPIKHHETNNQKPTYKEQQYTEAGEIPETFAPTWYIRLLSLYRTNQTELFFIVSNGNSSHNVMKPRLLHMCT